MNYFLLFQDDDGNIYSHCNITAASNQAAIATARRDYASDSGAGYEIWRKGHRIHTELPTYRQAA
jgi:hypothetical protein